MISGFITGATRLLGKHQGYKGLAVRDEIVHCVVNGPDTPSMVTSWIPTPKELDALNRGAPVHVRLMGKSHPPINVLVGEIPE